MTLLNLFFCYWLRLVAYEHFVCFPNVAFLFSFNRTFDNREMSVVKGDYLEIINMDRKWWKVRNMNQEVGYVPYSILRMMIYKDPQDFLKEKAAMRQRSPAPRPRSPSPDVHHQSMSPSRRYKRSPSPRRRTSPSPNRRSTSPRRRSISPRRHSPSSQRRHQRPSSPAESIPPPPPPQPAFVETPTILREAFKKRQKISSIHY